MLLLYIAYFADGVRVSKIINKTAGNLKKKRRHGISLRRLKEEFFNIYAVPSAEQPGYTGSGPQIIVLEMVTLIPFQYSIDPRG